MVLIDMKMPDCCWDCPFCLDFEFLDPYECAACMHDFEDGIDIYEKSKPGWCPLKEYSPSNPLTVTTNIYDTEEIHHGCTVQVLRNSVTGDVSVGWRKESGDCDG